MSDINDPGAYTTRKYVDKMHWIHRKGLDAEDEEEREARCWYACTQLDAQDNMVYGKKVGFDAVPESYKFDPYEQDGEEVTYHMFCFVCLSELEYERNPPLKDARGLDI